MRRVRFTDPAGTVRVGDWTDEGIEAAGSRYDPEAVTLLAPVVPAKVLGVGYNYWSVFQGSDEDPPDQPRIWWKGGPNVVSGPNDTVRLPSKEVVFEAELGVVISEQCRDVAKTDAMDVIAGFTCVNDLSDQAHTDDPAMIRVKSFDNAAPMGPVVASPDRVPTEPRTRLWLNGEKQQDTAETDDGFVYSVPEVIAAFSDRITLEPDDVIMMGNPGGFAPLSNNDTITIEIEGIGRFKHTVEIKE